MIEGAVLDCIVGRENHSERVRRPNLSIGVDALASISIFSIIGSLLVKRDQRQGAHT